MVMRWTIVVCTALLMTFAGVRSSEAGPRNDSIFWRYYDYPWCLHAMTGLYECSYATLEQCNYARNGVGGSCSGNPRYVDRSTVPRGKQKRAHR
jgi:hypothetical protein